MKHKILLADDDALFLKLTSEFLENSGFAVDQANSGAEALETARSRRGTYSLAILDYRMEDRCGATVARELVSFDPDLYIVMYSADPSRDALAETWKSGAVEFIDKTVEPDSFLSIVRRWCLKYEQTRSTLKPFEPNQNSSLIASIGLIGRSSAMASVVRDVTRFRQRRTNVLVLGESGTGKERIARALHTGSKHLFRAVNCASYSGDTALMEADLFGAERGAYTGADRDRKGIFAEASGGTVFLDEIHTLSLPAQQKLLRTLQERTIRPLGSTQEIPVNFRLVAAAKPDLEKRAKTGTFLPDLFYRLYVLCIDIPPLRERVEDVEPLVEFFCRRYCENNKEQKRFLVRTVNLMKRYSWPGNVRELENTVERLCARSIEETISPEHLDSIFFEPATEPELPTGANFWEQLESYTSQKMAEALREVRSVRGAARQLGMPSSTFYGLMKRFRLTVPAERKNPWRYKEGNA